MSLDFHHCPKCNRDGMSWDARAKIIRCLYISCQHVIRDIAYAGSIPTETEMTAAIEKEIE